MLSIYLDPRRISARRISSRAARDYVDYVKASRPATPGGEVLVPGEPEARTRAQRLENGIPLPAPDLEGDHDGRGIARSAGARMTATPPPEAIAAEILKQTAALGPDGSISPEDVAKALAPEWRPLLGPVRRAAIDLSGTGQIDILRKGKPVAPADVRGVMRLRIGKG